MAALVRFLAVTLLLLFTFGEALPLPIGDINIIFLSDLHGFVSGADGFTLGAVLSFVDQVKALHARDKDVYLAYGGDLVGGNGMLTDDVLAILERLPWDIMTLGDSDISDTTTLSTLTQPGGFLSWFSEQYVSSNILQNHQDLLLQPFRIMEGISSTIFVLGFVDELTQPAHAVSVQRVADAFQKHGIVQALNSEIYDAIIVLAHMENVQEIHSNIRQHVDATMPIQFLSGQSRDSHHSIPDFYTRVLGSGSYLEAIGFASVPKFQENSQNFQHLLLEASRDGLRNALELREWELTSQGQALEDYIVAARDRLHLDDTVGCSPRQFDVDEGLDDENSLWALWKEEVVPTTFIPNARAKIIFQGTDPPILVESLPKGWLRLDDLYIASPIQGATFRLVARSVSSTVIHRLNATLNEGSSSILPNFLLIGVVVSGKSYDIYTVGEDALKIITPEYYAASKATGKEPAYNVKQKDTKVTTVDLLHKFVKREWSNCSSTQKWHLVDEEEELETVVRKHARKARGLVGVLVALGITCLLILLTVVRNRVQDAELYEFELVSGIMDDEDEHLVVADDGSMQVI